jgi:hypothetical protein
MIYSSRIYSDMINDLVRDLTGRSDVRRASAVERCGGLPEDLLLEITSRLLIQYHKQVAWRWSVFLLGAIGVVSLAYLLQGNALFIYGILGLAVAQHLQLTNRHTGRSLHALLQSSEDKRLVPILLLRYTSPDGGTLRAQHSRVRDLGLTQLLLYVVESDQEMWTGKMLSRLTSLLRSPYKNQPMTCSVLHALGAIADETALPAIAPLIVARKRVWPRGNLNIGRIAESDISEAASLCDAAIRERAARRHQNAELLRACGSDLSLQESLPRAVENDGYPAVSELMRSIGRSANPDQESGRNV